MSGHSSQCDADIVKINISVFKKHYLSSNKKTIPENLYNKKKEIYDNNTCFHSCHQKPFHNQSSLQTKPIVPNGTAHNSISNTNNTYSHHTGHNKTHTHNRLYIITSDFTEDSKTKKQFMSYLNKLTETNMTSIHPKIKNLLDNITDKKLQADLYDIVWDFIKKSPNDVYLTILQFFEENITVNYIEKYIDGKLWYPPEYVFENNLLTADDALYDLYCDYVKWKNNVTNMIKVICNLDIKKHLQNKLLTDLYDLFFKCLYDPTTKHLLHFALEQMQTVMKVHYNKNIKDNLKNININELESSCKFLIMDILQA